MKVVTYFIAFYRYTDSEVWQKTGLWTEKGKLEEYIKKTDYVNLDSIQIKEIQLNE